MDPCNTTTNCYCVYYLSKESKDALLHKFKQEGTVGLQKQFVYGMLSSSSDDDGYLRCFKVSENIFLYRDGLSNVLQMYIRVNIGCDLTDEELGKQTHGFFNSPKIALVSAFGKILSNSKRPSKSVGCFILLQE
jgi:hypothetical protein